MPFKKMLTLYFLLFVLGLLSTKSLFSDFSESGLITCAGFGHIHNYKQNSSATATKTNEIKTSRDRNADFDDDCHEGKIASGYQIFSPITFVPFQFSHRILYALVFHINSNFKSPDLKLSKKPPRLA